MSDSKNPQWSDIPWWVWGTLFLPTCFLVFATIAYGFWGAATAFVCTSSGFQFGWGLTTWEMKTRLGVEDQTSE